VIDEDTLDLHQAFVDLTVGVPGPFRRRSSRRPPGDRAPARDGCTRCREGPNVPLSSASTAVRAISRTAGPWRLDGWAARPVDKHARCLR